MLKSRLQFIIRITAFIIALGGTFSRIFLSLNGDMGSNVFLYFTVQSNLIVCLYLGIEVLGRSKPMKPAVQGGVLMYITITGLVYNILLAPGWHPEGIDLLITTINHTITPLLFLLDWILSQEYGTYRKKHLLYWLIYPLCYALFASIEGALTGDFRYFFMDFINQSTREYLLLMLMVILVFLFIGFVILKFNNLNLRRKEAENGIAD
ncbi:MULTISPECIES: Pr6Pr family membrane protein [unclassified Oceanispirochaeta]|uniref:Pr6Pr family membrane protein n=1 Tax=unclassified Oceanispirochaeta TaxID=2635722 RepID=UPI0011C0584A|nr:MULTISPECIES: Pr6Pr family membrane protein [unclassified Oceanispirochaeta]MBF9016606.1 Pr6Pr family membrane protein [Oceanispirochaeta sp. M2]NPD73069.1 Pr6Pr family membrane protein [Oceanispirochaeta sp. M1]